MSRAVRRRGPIRSIIEGVASIEDWVIVRTTFFAMLAGTAAVLYIDYSELNDVAALGIVPDQPVLPAFDPDHPTAEPGPAVTTDRALLDAPLAVALKSGGILEVIGTIDVGSAERFATEVEAHGEYIEVVALNSPGGSVNDAIAIGALIREKGFTTSVATGAICASSCPLILASGVERIVEPETAIGVHQIYARVAAGELPTGVKAAGEAMSDAQKTTAVITRHLSEMGVDPALWLHALETPPTRLYYLSPEEMAEYRLTTE